MSPTKRVDRSARHLKQGHEVCALVQRPGEPTTAKEAFWPAYERLTIRRNEK